MIDSPSIGPQPGMARCEVTGKLVPRDQLIPFNGQFISPEGKQRLLERLPRAGVAAQLPFERPTVIRRCLCALVDLSLILVVMMFIAVFVQLVILVKDTPNLEGIDANHPPVLSELGTKISNVLVPLAWILYYGLMHGLWGRTLGKMLGRVRVVRVDGQPMGLGTGFFRAVVYVVPFLLGMIVSFTGNDLLTGMAIVGALCWVLADIMVAILDTEEQRSLHDRICGTRVVSTRPL